MVEREMQELLWRYPERLLNEKLSKVSWESSGEVGRADLVFEDPYGRLLIVEVKRGILPRGAIGQLLDYFGMIKVKYPDKAVEMMAVANVIPSERRVACETYNIDSVEISEKKFRDLAAEVNYVFASEQAIITTPPPPTGGTARPCSELMAVVNAYNTVAPPDLQATGTVANTRTVHPSGWSHGKSFYFFKQMANAIVIGLRIRSQELPFPKSSVGNQLPNSHATLHWTQRKHGHLLSVNFTLTESPRTIPRAMLDLIDMTRIPATEGLKGPEAGPAAVNTADEDRNLS
jgi:hypothetical protein